MIMSAKISMKRNSDVIAPKMDLFPSFLPLFTPYDVEG
jgi:hypothetical protein